MYAGCTIGEAGECVNPWMYIDAFLLGFWSPAALSAATGDRRPRSSLPFQVRCRQSRPADSRNRAPCHRPLSPLEMQGEGDHASSSRRAGRYHHVDRPSRGTRCPASRNTAGRTGADAPAKIARLRSPIALFSPIDFLAVGRPQLVFRVDCRRTRFDPRRAPEMDPRLSPLSARCAAKNV